MQLHRFITAGTFIVTMTVLELLSWSQVSPLTANSHRCQ